MPLSDQQTQKLRQMLQDLIEDLASSIAGSSDAARPVELDQPAMGRVSRIDAIQRQKMSEANLEAQKSRLQLARAALHRLEEDEFGECLACGEEIALARLEARPESLYCIECQSARER